MPLLAFFRTLAVRITWRKSVLWHSHHIYWNGLMLVVLQKDAIGQKYIGGMNLLDLSQLIYESNLSGKNMRMPMQMLHSPLSECRQNYVQWLTATWASRDGIIISPSMENSLSQRRQCL